MLTQRLNHKRRIRASAGKEVEFPNQTSVDSGIWYKSAFVSRELEV